MEYVRKPNLCQNYAIKFCEQKSVSIYAYKVNHLHGQTEIAL